MPPLTSGDFFQRLRASTREVAGVPWYDPSAASAAAFPPTLRDAVAALDRSTPSYLRCESCHARLFRGLQSTVCAFCGAEPRREFPISLAFTSTVAYRNLLQSLDLDGNELVTPNAGSKDSSSRGNNAPGEEVILSSLFDFELKWPREEKKVERSSSSQTPHPNTQPLNLSGIDLDNFFSEAKITTIPSVSNPHPETSKVSEALLEACASVDSEGPNDFGSLRSSSIALPPANIRSDNVDHSFADWEGISGVEMDKIAGFNSLLQQSDVAHSKPLEAQTSHLSSPDSWNHDNDVWQSADMSVSSSVHPDNIGTHGLSLELQGGKVEASANVENINDDPLDSWQDFTSSHGVSVVVSNTLPVNDVKDTTSKATDDENSLDMLDDEEFGEFLQSDSLSAKMPIQSDLPNSREQLFAQANFDSVRSVEATPDICTSDTPNGNASSLPDTNQFTVDDLLSQMHDLSFMLESKLCLPKPAAG